MTDFQEYFGETHNMVRQTVKKFVEREIKPFVDEWEEQGGFPRDLYRKAGKAGILGIGYPEAYGGSNEYGEERRGKDVEQRHVPAQRPELGALGEVR